jgi:hypothetical protein
MLDTSRFGNLTSGRSARKRQAFFREFTLKKGSFTKSAKRVGFFIFYYFIAMFSFVVTMALLGIVSIAIPLVFIPLAAWIAYRMARATATAEETNGQDS